MKKIELIGKVGILLLLFGTYVQANLWSSLNNFTPEFRKEKFIESGPIQQGNVQTAIDQGFVFQNATTESFTSTGNADAYVTSYTAKPSVFQRDYHLDSKIKIIPAPSPSPEPPSPEPPSPLPTLPGT
jgi:hypothetical protein